MLRFPTSLGGCSDSGWNFGNDRFNFFLSVSLCLSVPLWLTNFYFQIFFHRRTTVSHQAAGGDLLFHFSPFMKAPTRFLGSLEYLLDRSIRAGGGKFAISLPDFFPPLTLFLRLVFQVHSGFNLTEFETG
jgi:hypothetical protein